jgi:small neutral amino acid transporter SnatA (MarC family)
MTLYSATITLILVIERLMGMILTTMAVQMFLTGFGQFLHA